MRLASILAACSTCLAFGACDDLAAALDDVDLDLGDVADATDATDATVTNYTAVNAGFEVQGDDFYRMPWPSDFRLSDDGTLDLDDFPDPGVPLFALYANRVGTVDGYSLMPVIYVQLDADPIPETPLIPADSLTEGGPVQLIDVSPDGCGTRIPIEVQINHVVDDYIGDNMLMVAPVPGFALRADTSYALVVRTSLGNSDGFAVAPAAQAVAALDGSHEDAALNAVYAPLRDCLSDTGLTAADIAISTVFSTQDPITELRAIQRFVADPDKVPTATVSTFAYSDADSRAGYETYRGVYETPIFQDGQSPYVTTGGAIHFDNGGQPIVQRSEEVPFTVVVPRNGTPPYDLLLWVDGTGASEVSWVRSSVTQEMLSQGFAVASYVAQFHGDRATPGANEELHSYNYLNPDSFRDSFRQQVADTSYFLRVMTEARDQMDGLAEIDDSRIVYAGQSQGANLGTMVAAVEPRIEAFVLNGVGGYLSVTAVERVDPFDIAALIADIAGISPDFNRFHPLMALAQTGGDVADPHSFAPHWSGWEEHPAGTNVLLVNGIQDHTTPERSMNSIVVSSGVAPIDPAGWNVDPFGVWDRFAEPMPIQGNRPSLDGGTRTHAAFLSNTTGHFTIYDRADARELAVRFLRSAADGDARVE